MGRRGEGRGEVGRRGEGRKGEGRGGEGKEEERRGGEEVVGEEIHFYSINSEVFSGSGDVAA